MARWLSYQQTWLVVAPQAVEPDAGALRQSIRRVVIEPLVAPAGE